MKKKRYIIIAAVIILAAAAGLIFYSNREKIDELGVVVPSEKMFIDAPFADACEALNITFVYDDSSPLVSVEDSLYRGIRFRLAVTPKEGVEVKDFYCTIVLNEWIEEHAQIKTPRMGMPKSMAADMPSETKGFNSEWERVIDAEEARTEEYALQIVAPVRIMVSYDNHREYYLVTPEFKQLKDGSE